MEKSSLSVVLPQFCLKNNEAHLQWVRLCCISLNLCGRDPGVAQETSAVSGTSMISSFTGICFFGVRENVSTNLPRCSK